MMKFTVALTGLLWILHDGSAFAPLSLNKVQQLHPTSQLASSVQATAAVLTSETIDIPLSSIRGEADRAFRTGMVLEKNGQARAASAAFHEAATLFQCFIDCGEEFQHVSSLQREEIPGMLAYTAVRLAHLSHDALGDSKAAYRLYREAGTIDPTPSAVSFDGMGTALEASFGSLHEAVACYRQAHKMRPNNRLFLFHLAVALERLGEVEESEQLMEVLRRSELRHSCLVDSWGYVRWHTRKQNPNNLHRGTRDMLRIALDAAQPLLGKNNLVCEFGVASGRSLRMTQELLPLDAIEIHGFDTFTGLPQAWGNEPAGSYSTGGVVPDMEQGKVFFHKGLFRHTIPRFLESQPEDAVLAYANIDCDLYTSTLDILESMYDRIVPGTVLVFDEYLCHATWRQDEFRAFRECCKRFGWHYEYLAFSLSTKQAVVRITSQLGVGSVSQSEGR
jgi:tetratricopeptide (TPR) repeat protein